ncbi:diguanylate cyclase domain-containing protein [Clostridium sp.]|jgi:diguanylate cyclase (GGDEF)-like protein/PAS domain S-box-containing protein|uniref:diguanylate cyclase domain-containing protein n=1 Tax=Clostridium sp. TaxID=1506 RepID=UPI003EEA6EB9
MKGTKVLIVEDSKVTAKTIRNGLIKLEYEVSGICSKGEEAIRASLIHNPDVILMDIELEGDMNGIETATKITNILNIPVIYLTALADKTMLEKTNLREGYSFLVKPFEETELLFNIEMALYKHEMKNKLEEERKWLNAILESINDGVIAMDKDENVKFMNESARNLIGYTNDKAEGKLKDILKLLDPKTREEVQVLDLTEKSEKILIGTHERECITLCQVTSIPKRNSGKMGYVVSISDISQEKKLKKDIHYLTFNDQLTGINNRTYFEEEISKYNDPEYLPVSIIMSDLNGLKLTNDVFGHQVGDELIKKAAQVLKKSCRASDLLARIGGDEFIIVLPNIDKKAAEIIGARIKKFCSEENSGFGKLSISVGTATNENSEQDIFHTINEADKRMYANKFSESKKYREDTLLFIKNKLKENSCSNDENGLDTRNTLLEMGKKMNLSQNELEKISLYTEMGDIGMISIPEDIKKKNTKLNDKEWDIVKKHTEAGYKIATAIQKFTPVADYILCHHERWDGTGYPQKLKGEEIPMISRMISIVEAYVSMTNKRNYRKTMTKEEAILEISKCSGSQFDPILVEIFKKIV